MTKIPSLDIYCLRILSVMNRISCSTKENFLKLSAISAATTALSAGAEKSIPNFVHPVISLSDQRDEGKQDILQ